MRTVGVIFFRMHETDLSVIIHSLQCSIQHVFPDIQVMISKTSRHKKYKQWWYLKNVKNEE